MGRKLDKLTIRGFKSIQSLEDFQLGDLNVLIGANGSGKSNFIQFFDLVRSIANGTLQYYAIKHGPADSFFYGGVSQTRVIEATLSMGSLCYEFRLEPADDGRLILAFERLEDSGNPHEILVAHGPLESQLENWRSSSRDQQARQAAGNFFDFVKRWQSWHFHDTSMTAGMRRDCGVEQTGGLRSDASNLTAMLMQLRDQHPHRYALLRTTLQRIAPYFKDFQFTIRPQKAEDLLHLTWLQKDADYIFPISSLSDGTIRFVCLLTALLQPDAPELAFLDEPEIGLHPDAIAVLAGLLRSASHKMQIVVATQSPWFIGELKPEQMITADQIQGASQFRRLDLVHLRDWLEDFTVPDLWEKGIIAGGVNHA